MGILPEQGFQPRALSLNGRNSIIIWKFALVKGEDIHRVQILSEKTGIT